MKVYRIISLAVMLALLTTLAPIEAFAQEAPLGEDISPDSSQTFIESGRSEQEPELQQAESNVDGQTALQEAQEPQNGVPDEEYPGPEQAVIEEIRPLEETIANQTITVKSGQKVYLPETLSVRLAGSDQFFDLAAVWTAEGEATTDKAGSFSYTAAIEGYSLAEGVSLPVIHVEVVRADTKVSGLKTSLTKKSRSVLAKNITVAPAYGRTVKLQMKKNGKWITKKTFRLKETAEDTLKLVFSNDWWKLTSSDWRLAIPESEEGSGFISKIIKVKTKRYYQNPAGYLQIKDKITLKDSGGYNLKSGYMGLKVLKVNQYFKIGDKNWPRYTSETKRRVKAFQKKKGLKATGIVNKETWLKMGFSEKDWYNLGAYVSPIKVNPSSSKKQHIEAMISTAKKYLGDDYVVGASGKPGQGADCSGLVMQAMYAAGVDPKPVSSVRHAKAGYEYESRNIWKLKQLKTVPYSKKQRGDLIFYQGRNGAINHIAIYLGGGKVIESWPDKVVIKPIKNSHRSKIYGVKRVFQ